MSALWDAGAARSESVYSEPAKGDNEFSHHPQGAAGQTGERSDVHAEPGGQLTSWVETGGGIGTPPIDQRLNQRCWMKFGPVSAPGTILNHSGEQPGPRNGG